MRNVVAFFEEGNESGNSEAVLLRRWNVCDGQDELVRADGDVNAAHVEVLIPFGSFGGGELPLPGGATTSLICCVCVCVCVRACCRSARGRSTKFASGVVRRRQEAGVEALSERMRFKLGMARGAYRLFSVGRTCLQCAS